jgi:addiction module RelB/DinJ family antitoxin
MPSTRRAEEFGRGMDCPLRFGPDAGLPSVTRQTLAGWAWLCSFCVMPSSAILRTRIDPRRKARVEKILDQLGVTPTQAVNMLFAQIERRKAIPFAIAIEDNSDILPPTEHVARVWDKLDREDFSHLDTR